MSAADMRLNRSGLLGGDSGGPVFNKYGKVIGVNSSIAIGVEGLESFSVSLRMNEAVVNEIRSLYSKLLEPKKRGFRKLHMEFWKDKKPVDTNPNVNVDMLRQARERSMGKKIIDRNYLMTPDFLVSSPFIGVDINKNYIIEEGEIPLVDARNESISN